MSKLQTEKIQQAIDILEQVLADREARPGGMMRMRSPVLRFVYKYLENDPSGELTSQECLDFYREITAADELPPMRPAVFLRRLPAAMHLVLNVRRHNNLRTETGYSRGYSGVGIRERELSEASFIQFVSRLEGMERNAAFDPACKDI